MIQPTPRLTNYRFRQGPAVAAMVAGVEFVKVLISSKQMNLSGGVTAAVDLAIKAPTKGLRIRKVILADIGEMLGIATLLLTGGLGFEHSPFEQASNAPGLPSRVPLSRSRTPV